jgi:hypothetical protein
MTGTAMVPIAATETGSRARPQRRLARRQPEQREPHQHHPAGNVEHRGDEEPRPDRARDVQTLPAHQRQRGQQKRADHPAAAVHMVKGGNSPIRYFVTGQLNPQPIEVMARNISPAGVMRARASGRLESRMSRGPGGESDKAYLAAIRPRGHHLSDMPA